MYRIIAGIAFAGLALVACSPAGDQGAGDEPRAAPISSPSTESARGFAVGPETKVTGGDQLDLSDITVVASKSDAGPESVRGSRVDAPRSLQIPSLGAIPVDRVAVAEDGQVEIPEDVSRVGWYRFGPEPGSAEGAAVIVGHRDGQGAYGAFYNLSEVSEGEIITVRTAGQEDLRYRVVSNESVEKKVLPLNDVFDREGRHRLILISCGGEYVPSQGGYQDNTVLTAIPEGA